MLLSAGAEKPLFSVFPSILPKNLYVESMIIQHTALKPQKELVCASFSGGREDFFFFFPSISPKNLHVESGVGKTNFKIKFIFEVEVLQKLQNFVLTRIEVKS